MKNKIIIIVAGGVVCKVMRSPSHKTQFFVVDLDSQRMGEDFIQEIIVESLTPENLEEYFKQINSIQA